MKLLSVVGARPNFMKLAPLARSLADRSGVEHMIVHTGQHYDRGMSDTFFDDLAIPAPDLNLGVGSGTHAEQTGQTMVGLEKVIAEERPDMMLVFGDVNSTVAGALVAKKAGVRVAHVEAGLRSFDMGMPEEVNRVLTDRISDLLFAPSEDGVRHLLSEGVPQERIHLVGNIMIDSLEFVLQNGSVRAPDRSGDYAVLTLHRPSNVDDPATLQSVFRGLKRLTSQAVVVFPVHPRTRKNLDKLDPALLEGVELVDPVSYPEMVGLVKHARLVVTDSGGLQEETTYLGVPCVTVRRNTERPVTITSGTNRLADPEEDAVAAAIDDALEGPERKPCAIPLWDGRAAERIVEIVLAAG